MHFGSLLAIMACLASLVSAVAFTSWPTDLHVGEPATLEWNGDPYTPVTITLQKGPPGNLKDVEVLTSEGKGGSFTWTPKSSLPEGSNYAFKIQQGNQVNYSGLVTISGGPTRTSTGTTASATTETSLSTTETSHTNTMTTSMTTTGTNTHETTTTGSTSAQSTASSNTTTMSATTTADTWSTIASSASHSASVSVETKGAANTGSPSSSAAIPPPNTNSASVQQRPRPLGLVLGAVGLVMYHM